MTGAEMEYGCGRCGACCRWAGIVRVTAAEIERIAAYLGVSERAFVEAYTKLTETRSGLALTERPDGACVFLEGAAHCRIHAVKPGQCRDFPGLWRVPDLEQVCQARPCGPSSAQNPVQGKGVPGDGTRVGKPSADSHLCC